MIFQPQKSIEVKILDERVRQFLLKKGTPDSAAYDLVAPLDDEIILEPGDRCFFGCGFAISIRDSSYAAVIIPRSGSGSKGLVIANGTGLIDADYQGEIKMSLLNTSRVNLTVKPFDRVAQMLFIPVATPLFSEVDEFISETQRGDGGFGSTGR